MTNNWQPIATAPKDRRVILLLTLDETFGHEINTGYWGKKSSFSAFSVEKKYEWCSNGCIDNYLTFEPDMWHPLPELPKKESAQITKIKKEGK